MSQTVAVVSSSPRREVFDASFTGETCTVQDMLAIAGVSKVTLLKILDAANLLPIGKVVSGGRGRPAGSTSFVNVSLADLEQFVGNGSAIPVSRVWLEKMGLTVQQVERTISEKSDNPTIEFKLTKLEE